MVVIDHNDELLARAQVEFADLAGSAGVEITVRPNTAKQGLSGGRNVAIADATGEIVVFLDDDASAEPGWLAALLAPYADPNVVGVGGVAVPLFSATGKTTGRPVMLPAAVAAGRGELDWVVGCTYAGQPEVTTDVRNLMGCNMSFRSSVFEKVGGFAESLGRIGKTPLGCEETELCIRARQADPNARIVFEPAARVRHRVSADRVTWKYLFARCFAEGVSKAAVSRMVGSEAALESEKSYATKVLPKAIGRELARVVRGHGAGFAGASAVVLALSTTSAGYVRGRLARPVGSAASH